MSLLRSLSRSLVGGLSRRAFASEAFASAQQRVQALSEAPDNQTKLKLYALFKQSSVGPPDTKRPGMMDPVGRFKWDAWDSVKGMSQDEASAAYVALVDELVSADGGEGGAAAESTASGDGWVLTGKRGKVFEVILNRPEKKNALTPEMYRAIQAGLEESAKDTSTAFTVIKAKGDYYSSGNDLGNFMVDMSDIAKVAKDSNVLLRSVPLPRVPSSELRSSGNDLGNFMVDMSDIAKVAKDSNVLLRNFVGAMIDHPKPLMGLVQGPAIGICVTTLALFDVVYAADSATFHAPFSHLGQSPEGCSSYLFPRIMGNAKAGEFLLFGRKLSAMEAKECGLITNVFPAGDFERTTTELLDAYAKLPPQSMGLSKRLIGDGYRDTLHKVNAAECDLLEERWQSAECANAIANFFSRKA